MKMGIWFVAILMLVPLCAVGAPKKIKTTKNVADLPDIENGSQILIKIPDAPNVLFHGKVSYDRVGVEGGDILYPAPDAGSFVAGVLFHALLVDSIKDKKENAQQLAADAVLSPYTTVIQSMTYNDLFSNGINIHTRSASIPGSLSLHNESASPGWILESAPVFIMTQSQDALILQNTIAIYLEGDPGKLIYQTSVEVVSDSIGNNQPQSHWLLNNGEKLRNTSVNLLASSITIILNELFGIISTAELPQQTFRYAEGNKKVIERGGLIHQNCERVLIRTLWNTLKSAPIYQTETEKNACLNDSVSITNSNI